MRVRLGVAMVALLGAAACGGGGGDAKAPTSGTGAAANPASSQPAAATGAGATAADTVALGTVLDKGAPKSGVPVLVVAWPNSATLDKQTEGEDV